MPGFFQDFICHAMPRHTTPRHFEWILVLFVNKLFFNASESHLSSQHSHRNQIYFNLTVCGLVHLSQPDKSLLLKCPATMQKTWRHEVVTASYWRLHRCGHMHQSLKNPLWRETKVTQPVSLEKCVAQRSVWNFSKWIHRQLLRGEIRGIEWSCWRFLWPWEACSGKKASLFSKSAQGRLGPALDTHSHTDTHKK